MSTTTSTIFPQNAQMMNLCIRSPTIAFLKIAVANTPEFRELYRQHIEAHNRAILDADFPNSGFDLFFPDDTVFDKTHATKMVDFQIKAEMSTYTHTETDDKEFPAAFYVFPRSSISKTELILANHTGIIDSGYRGNLIGAFRWLNPNLAKSYLVPQSTRLLQICHPSLCPIIVELVDESALSTTARGAGGFGSTGVSGLAK